MTTRRAASRGRFTLGLAGVLATLATLVGYAVDTSAQSADVAKANAEFTAEHNFWLTPVVSSTNCSPGVALAQNAEVSWTSAGTPPNGGSYSYYVTIHRDTNPDEMQVIGRVTGTSVKISRDSSRRNKGWYARIYTINGPKISTGYRAEGFNIDSLGLVYSKCSGNREYSPNLPAPNESTYAPGISPQVLNLVENYEVTERPNSGQSPLGGKAEEVAPGAAKFDGAINGEAEIDVELPTSSISPTITARSPAAVTASPTPRPSVSPEPSALATTSVPSTSPRASTSTASAMASLVSLPGGGAAEIVSGTTLRVAGGDGRVCTAKVREGSTLDFRSGELEVTDVTETRIVDPNTCRMS